jgi:hypothetical protein
VFTKTKIAFAAALILGTASTALAVEADRDEDDQGGFVIPCSLDGVNPVYHHGIFGNAAIAREFGFAKSRDGSWQVERNCVRGPYHH